MLGAGEHGWRLRGVFGIPHSAVKINDQLLLDCSELKNKRQLKVEGEKNFALFRAEGEEQWTRQCSEIYQDIIEVVLVVLPT